MLLDHADLDGHDQLAALMAESRYPPIGETLEFYLVELERGQVVFAGSPSLRVFNLIGSVHGGYAATLLDSACGCSVHSSLPTGQGYTTLELKVSCRRALIETSGRCARKASWRRSAAASAFRKPEFRCQETPMCICDTDAADFSNRTCLRYATPYAEMASFGATGPFMKETQMTMAGRNLLARDAASSSVLAS